MGKDLEGEEPKVEEVEPTSEEKEVEPTTPKVEPTIRTYTQKELDEAVGKGRASTQSQLSLSQASAKKFEAIAEEHKASVEALETERQDIQTQLDELVTKQFAEDPEARQAYVDRRGIAEEKRKLAKEKTVVEKKLYDAEKLAWSAGMSRKADMLVKETGIDAKELEACQTEEEMEVKALRFQLEKEPKKEEPKEEPKFDKGVSSVGGKVVHPTTEQLDAMSPEKYAEWAAERYK